MNRTITLESKHPYESKTKCDYVMQCPSRTKSVIEFNQFEMCNLYKYEFSIQNMSGDKLVEFDKYSMPDFEDLTGNEKSNRKNIKKISGKTRYISSESKLLIAFDAGWNQNNYGFSLQLSCRGWLIRFRHVLMELI